MKNTARAGQEKLRGKLMEMVKRGQKTIKAASLELGISYRQGKRVYQRYLAGGDRALVHKSKGKASNHKTESAIIERALALYREQYPDFGPTLAQEKLKERDGIELSVSTLRRALIAAKLWSQTRNSSEYHARREPRERFGELVQFDGSSHEWFEKRGLGCTIITVF
jgi:transposase